MKRPISKIVVGFLGLGVGFSLCYITLVGSRTEAKATVITIASDGSLYLGNQQLDLSQLSADLKKQGALGYMITIRADKHTDFKRVVAVVDACKAAGVTQIAGSINLWRQMRRNPIAKLTQNGEFRPAWRSGFVFFHPCRVTGRTCSAKLFHTTFSLPMGWLWTTPYAYCPIF